MEFLQIVLVTLQPDQPVARVIIPFSEPTAQSKSAAALPRRFALS